MAINTFSTLKTAVADWLDRDDISSAIDNMISLMEARLYTELRVRDMEAALSLTVASGTVTLPTDFIEFKSVYINGSPIQAVEFQSAHWIRANFPQRSSSGKPRYAALDAGTLIFAPYPDSTYSVLGTYYARPTALSVSNETNFLTTKAPDILLYGTLTHSALYLGQDARLPAWLAAYEEALSRLMLAERSERYPSAVPLRATAQ